jgi:hypothetical protein
MAVKFTKPEINVREKLAELDKPSGIAGEAMLRAETPQEQQALIGVGRRNLLINGAFQVWQRGTSSTSFTGSTRGYIADRWSFRFATSAERSTDVPEGEAFKYSIKVVVASTSPDSFIIQAIEDSDRFAGQTVTFSYWIKPSESCETRDDYWRGGHGTHKLNGGVWQKVTNTFVVPSDITVNEFLYIQFPANKVITFYVTGIQLELGKVATPFEHRSYGEELALCQRYYYQLGGIGGVAAATSLSSGSMYNSTAVNLYVPFPVPMRASPGISKTVNGTGNWLNLYVGATGTVGNPTPQVGDSGTDSARVYIPSAHSGNSPSAAGAGVWAILLSGASLNFNAEL